MNAVGPNATPPYSQEAERAVLGSMLAAPALIGDVVLVADATDFYEPRHALIIDHLQQMEEGGEPIEVAALATRLRIHGDLDKVGGPEYLATLMRAASVPSMMYYAEIVKEDSIRREVMLAMQQAANNARHGSGQPVVDVVAEAMGRLDEITETKTSSEILRVGGLLDEAIDRLEELGANEGTKTGMPTGFYELDRLIYGLNPGQMVTVAARPAMGKSTLALDFARSAAIKNGLPTAFFSLEMSAQEINQRLLSSECSIDFARLRDGNLTERDWQRIAQRRDKISAAPLYIDDSASNTMMQIRRKCRRLQQRGGLSLIVIDYLQLMEADVRSDSRQTEVSGMSRAVKLLAKELKVPVVVLSQLNRGAENRSDNRPKVSDLRESGAIEQDSDIVLLVHREEVFDPDTPRIGEADLIIGKHRGGPTGTAVVGFQGGYSRFVDLSCDAA